MSPWDLDRVQCCITHNVSGFFPGFLEGSFSTLGISHVIAVSMSFLPSPLNHIWAYANERAQDGGCSYQTMWWGWALSHRITTWPPRSGRATDKWPMSQQTRLAVMKPQQKLWIPVAQVIFLDSDGKVTYPKDKVVFMILSDLILYISSFGWSWFLSFIIKL